MTDDPDQQRGDQQNTAGAARRPAAGAAHDIPQIDMLELLEFVEQFRTEINATVQLATPDSYVTMSIHLIRSHLESRPVTATSLIAASGVPYATGRRRLDEMLAAGLVEQRPRTPSGKTFSLHPSAKLMRNWSQACGRMKRLAQQTFNTVPEGEAVRDYYFGGSYMETRTIQAPRVISEPLDLPGGLRILVHGDPTFMVMDKLKRRFEQVIGCQIYQRAFSIDRLHDEILKDSERRHSRYDIVAVDLPWIGEFADNEVLTPLDDVLDLTTLKPEDFHAAGWSATHYGGRPFGVPSQTTPELLFYRRDLFADAGLAPPRTAEAVLQAARYLHDPARGRYGIAWNAARGTALGHTFMLICAAFGQPVLELPRNADGFDATRLQGAQHRPTIDTERSRDAAEYLRALMDVSPPDILSMSWYERVRPYAAGKVAMAYGYTLLAPYFELDPDSPANGHTDYLPHPAGPNGSPIAPVGGYALGIPANIQGKRRDAAAEALRAFTSPEAQKLYVLNGSRTAPRYSVGADPEVRRLSSIFEAVDGMSYRNELQFWPRPPVPQIASLIQLCGEECHDMLRGIVSVKEALSRAQARADRLMRGADA